MRSFIPNRPALAVFTLSALALSAVAGAPQALDRVPADADVVIGVGKLADFLSDIDHVNRLLGDKARPEMMFATSMVRGTPGVNLDGSAAIILDLPADPNAGDEPVVLALVPVADFGVFTQGRDAENGVVLMPFPDSEVYARDLGDGMAVLSDNADAARAFDAAKGRLQAHTARLGAAGGRVVDNAEVSVLLNADALRPYLDQGVAGMRQQGEMVAMMGGEQAAVGFNAFASIVTAAAADLSAGALGLTINDAGFSYDMAMQFKEGTKSASYFPAGGKTAGLVERLPAGPYMFAMAMDTSAPALGKIADAVDAWRASLPAEMRDQMGGGYGQLSLKQLTELSSGVAFVLGATPSRMGGGLFANATQYIRTDDPQGYQNALVAALNEADGFASQGMTLDTTVSPGAITIEGADLTAYGVTFKVDPQAAAAMGGMPGMDPAMIMQMVFGPTGGPAGYLGKVEGGVVQTLSQGPELTRKAVEAARAGKGLGAGERIKRAAAALQDGRVAEFYVGVDEILNAVGPMLMMFGAVPEFEPVAAMDPISMGLTTDAGGFTGRFHLPAATFQTLSTLVPAQGMDHDEPEEGFDF